MNPDLKNLQILTEGITAIETKGTYTNGTRINVDYEVLGTLYRGLCHKISSNFITSDVWSGIRVNFNESIAKETLPEVYVIVSSKNNSYGAIISKFRDGDAYTDFSSFNKEFWMAF